MQCLRRRSNPPAKGLSRRPGYLHTNGWPNVSTESGIQAECRSTGVSPPFITEDARGGPEDSSLLDPVEVPKCLLLVAGVSLRRLPGHACMKSEHS